MRRIPRPYGAIDRSLSSSNSLRNQSPFSLCRRTASPHPFLRATSASFSTTPNLSFILGKQDKKKHQQLVRRWQKRLLGESEPIGAHVDPFDPTSPVRIAPEDQGDELEVLAEEDASRDSDAIYEEESDGSRLRHVGGKKWQDQLEESKLAREYEKLTMRTYTPLTHKMADQIEDLTGTMYTLRDDNLMLAQKFHNFSNKPYTEWSFGRATPVRGFEELHSNFQRTLVEIYALKQANQDLDMTKSANRGVYDAPKWFNDVRLRKSKRGVLKLDIPHPHTLDDVVRVMGRVPDWSTGSELRSNLEATVEEEEVAVAEEPVPQMDPNTPAFKRAAIVKQDPDQKPFDFMSNRPIPRAVPQNPAIDPAVKAEESAPTDANAVATPSTSLEDANNAPTTDSTTIGDAEQETKLSGTGMELPRQTKRARKPSVKWQEITLTDPRMTFALAKRMSQRTGLYISDRTLNSVTKVSELFANFFDAGRPKPAKLFSHLHVVGQQQVEAAKKAGEAKEPSQTKADLGALLKMKNVEILRKKPNAKELRTKKGLSKVITREIRRGPLGIGPTQPGYLARKKEKSYVKRETKQIEGTRVAPSSGVAISPTAAHLLKERTARKKREWFDAHEKSWKEVDMLIRERKFAPNDSRI